MVGSPIESDQVPDRNCQLRTSGYRGDFGVILHVFIFSTHANRTERNRHYQVVAFWGEKHAPRPDHLTSSRFSQTSPTPLESEDLQLIQGIAKAVDGALD